jgi:thiaminase
MAMESDKVMFEVYREDTYSGKYRVVYYTELNEHNKEWEINRAMAGEHFYDGFIRNYKKEEAKDVIDALIRRMNEGERLTPEQFEQAITAYLPEPSVR